MKPKDGIDLEAILKELGQFGRYQIQTYCFIVVPILFCAMHNSQYIFAAGEISYRCAVPECEANPPNFEINGWGSWVFPAWGGRCDRFPSIGNECTSRNFLQNQTVACTAWVYEHDNTIVSQFDLACEEWKRTLVGTIHSAGVFAALPLTAYVSDTFGPRTAFILTTVSAGVSGVIRVFSQNYIVYLVLEFIQATLGAGIYSSGFILALEMVELNYRVLGGNIISSTFAMGQVICALVAWGFPYWRTLTLIIYAPSVLFIIYYFFLEESVRWLLSKGKKEEAARIIFKAAKKNKKKLSAKSVKMLTDDPKEDTKKKRNKTKNKVTRPDPIEQRKEPSLFMQVILSKTIMTRLTICSFWWITVTFIYYGLSITSVSLDGNSYVNYILTCLVEIPGYCTSVLTLNRFGRKSSIMTAFFICGISLASLPFVTDSTALVLAMIGKLNISMIFASIYIYTLELFPTRGRHAFMGTCSMVGRIGAMMAPQTPLLMQYMKSLPYIIFGVMAAFSGFLMLLTPETLKTKLPDTIQQAENIAVAPRTKQNATDIIND